MKDQKNNISSDEIVWFIGNRLKVSAAVLTQIHVSQMKKSKHLLYTNYVRNIISVSYKFHSHIVLDFIAMTNCHKFGSLKQYKIVIVVEAEA